MKTNQQVESKQRSSSTPNRTQSTHMFCIIPIIVKFCQLLLRNRPTKRQFTIFYSLRSSILIATLTLSDYLRKTARILTSSFVSVSRCLVETQCCLHNRLLMPLWWSVQIRETILITRLLLAQKMVSICLPITRLVYHLPSNSIFTPNTSRDGLAMKAKP